MSGNNENVVLSIATWAEAEVVRADEIKEEK